MTDTSKRDMWRSAENYDRYMGRWSRKVAPLFLGWLDEPGGEEWLDVGCGTGALSAAIVRDRDPRSLLGIDFAPAFVTLAERNVPDPRARFMAGDAQELPVDDNGFDAVVSGLMLNFVPDRTRALNEMSRVARPGSRVAFYVWDYPGRGVGFQRAFWEVACELDPAALELNQETRYAFCTEEGLTRLARAGGWQDVEAEHLEAETVFEDFDDYWTPFTLGTGPAPKYCADLDVASRERLRAALLERLPFEADGSLRFLANAWAVRGRAV